MAGTKPGHDAFRAAAGPRLELRIHPINRYRFKSPALIAITVDGPVSAVMAGLVPAIHASGSAIDSLVRITFYFQLLKLDRTVFSWMAGSSPAMMT
jgi:hypothetical protein